MMTGAIQLEKFAGISSMPQKAASAWSGALAELVGATYKPLVYCGTQIVKGVNYWFIAEECLMTATLQRRIVKLAINEFDGKYSLARIEHVLG